MDIEKTIEVEIPLMRHDAKLGLALGMLVIGFAVAFCFPRQPETTALQSTDIPDPIADGNLDFLTIRAYQSPSPEEEQQKQKPAETSALSQVATADAEATKSSAPPAPIAPLVAQDAESNNEADSGLTAKGEQSEETSDAKKTHKIDLTPRPKTYRVKAGDTLSGIASRCLGSSVRYLEIYEANQDQLTSPDDLKIGMDLLIPPITAPGPALSPASTSIADAAEKKMSSPRDSEHADMPSTPSGRPGEIRQPPQVPWMAERPSQRQ